MLRAVARAIPAPTQCSARFPAGDPVRSGYIELVTQHIQPLNSERARVLGPDHAEHAEANHRVSLHYASRANSDLRCTVRASDNELQHPHEAPPRGERTEPAE